MSASTQNCAEQVELLMKDGRWEEALAAAEDGLAKDPISHELLWNAGWAHFKLGQYARAAAYLRKAIDAGPLDHACYAALGATLSELKKYDEAELWLLRALAIQESYLTRICLASVYHKRQLTEVAEAIHKEGIRLRPRSRERLEAYADFLSDVGRESDATKIYEEAERLRANKG
jgi:tetratricopeptide (TPR) repeat protein